MTPCQKAARIAELLGEAEALVREIAVLPEPADFGAMLEYERPYSADANIYAEAVAELDNRDLIEERIRWQDAATVTAEELARRHRDDDHAPWRCELELLDELPVT